MSLKAEEILESLQRIRSCTDEAIAAVQKLFDETKSFSRQHASTDEPLKSFPSQLESHLFSSFANGLAVQTRPVDSPASEVSQERKALGDAQGDDPTIINGFTHLNAAAFFTQPNDIPPETNALPCPSPSPQAPNSAGIKNKAGTKMFKRFVENQEAEPASDISKATTSKPLPGITSLANYKHEVDLTFDWTDWQPTDFPATVSFVDIICFMLQRREAATPMAIANKANLFQPCFNVETLLTFALKQYDRLTSVYACSEPEKNMARQLLCEVVSSWGASESLEEYNSQELTANRRPPILRYYYFARLCIKKYEAPVPEALKKRAALSSIIAGLAALCVPSAMIAASNPTREFAQAVFNEAVSVTEDKCQSSIYESAKHLLQDNISTVAIYGCKFSPQRILSHEWTMSPPFASPGLIADPTKVAPYYVAMRISHEFMARLGKAKGILYHGTDQSQMAFKPKA
ncbi:hypothetical protein DSO57_1021190 [Entomophthora muscae]|uniref:Uncharacterized protein n=1 Tax=Entomophthora muscae TaxID=34485 RepID=A0ACC2T3L7_9FUNG|nr:hypothetical protein DSO57_1021190 [Entomophthora muscae]